MDTDMIEQGRKLEQQMDGMAVLLADIQADLAALPDCHPAAEASQKLIQYRARLDEAVTLMRAGQVRLEGEVQAQVGRLAEREAALEASRKELHALTRRLVQVQEDERRSLARDLHDTSGQAMTVLGLGLSLLKREGGCSPNMRSRIEELQRTAASVGEDLHRLAVNLRPASLDRYGLVAACEEIAESLHRQAAIPVDFHIEGLEQRLPADVETALYRIVQEACTNIVRYAGARRAAIAIRRTGQTVEVQVEDDGRGFDVTEALTRGRLGLVGMRERAEILGGTCEIESAPGLGTRVWIAAPLPTDGHGADAAEAEAARPLVLAQGGDEAASSELAELTRTKVLSEALADITGRMSTFARAPDLLTFVLTAAADAVGCDYAVIASHDAAGVGARWIVTHAYGLPPVMLGQRLVPAAVPLAQEIERTRGVVVVNNVAARDRLAEAARDSGVFSGAGFPLISAGRFLGAVAFVHNTAPVPFRPSEVGFLQHLSSLISLVLEIIHLRGG